MSKPKGLDHTGIVGKSVVIGLLVSCLEQLDVKSLRCLHQPIVIARNSLGSVSLQVTNRFYDRDDGNDSLCRTGRFVAVANDVDAGERAHTIVNADDSFGIVRNLCEAVLY